MSDIPATISFPRGVSSFRGFVLPRARHLCGFGESAALWPAGENPERGEGGVFNYEYCSTNQPAAGQSPVVAPLVLVQVQDPVQAGSLYDTMGKSQWVENV